jgi:D-alanyl-lipoteichoic acid acyltransferase DltB (MBOAT superfamily)
LINYFAARHLSNDSNQKTRERVFAGTVLANLCILAMFKYLRGWLGHLLAGFDPGVPHSDGVAHLAAPLGISYFVFAMIGCITDAYRQTWKLQGGIADFLLFGLFFPQISSGPIPRADRLLPQLITAATPTNEDRITGLRMIAFGLFKKYVVANRLNEYVNLIFASPGEATPSQAALACAFNFIQLYADFSGYVDIAIGTARLLGIHLDPNFDRPFQSTSVTELWRRWHMTLSFWLRDYVYMPMLIRIRNLGKLGVALALVATFALCGLWHGAAWTYLLFGVSQGIAMSIEFLSKSWRSRMFRAIPPAIVASAGNVYTIVFFALTEVVFRSSNLAQAGAIYRALFHWHMTTALLGAPQLGFYYRMLDLFALVCWWAVGRVFATTSTKTYWTPWFTLACASLILFIGHLGALHFIYAAF